MAAVSHKKISSFHPPQRVLMGPGPSNINPRVLAAMSLPVIGYLDPVSYTHLQNAKRLIIKVGSSLVTNDGHGLDHDAIAKWSEQIARLRHQGKEIILVSSGAIAEGMLQLGFSKRPVDIHELRCV